jgi:hypothetical protein
MNAMRVPSSEISGSYSLESGVSGVRLVWFPPSAFITQMSKSPVSETPS